MARKRRKNEMQAGELNLTAMIDVAFQLLSFFIITSHPKDVLTNLDVFRPAPDSTASKDTPKPNIIRIGVVPGGYLVNDRPMDLRAMDTILARLATLDKQQTVLISCDPQSRHDELVEALDLCAKAGLVNLSIVSSG